MESNASAWSKIAGGIPASGCVASCNLGLPSNDLMVGDLTSGGSTLILDLLDDDGPADELAFFLLVPGASGFCLA